MEYYFTRERIIEDIALEQGIDRENNIPLKEQMKALFTNKYWVILTFLGLLGGIVDNYKGGNVQYFYIQYMLGGINNDFMQMIYQICNRSSARYRCIPDIPDIQKSRNKESDRRRIFACVYRQHHRLDIPG